jgi:PAS domain S-box-containing protein
MSKLLVRPTGVERTFDSGELIVSKTDRKGIITYANELFCRLSGYPEAEIIGQPHNLVRHPDMPKVIFKTLWDTISAGKEIFAYVVNLSADGAHYWVLAHVTPSFGANHQIVGYHSNRRRPDPSAIAAITPLYAELCAEERRHGNATTSLAASTELLRDHLASRQLSYDELIWSVTPVEAAR